MVQRNFVAAQMIYIGLKFSLRGCCTAINFAQQSRAEHFISRTSALSLLISFYNATLVTVNLPYLVRLLSCRGSFSSASSPQLPLHLDIQRIVHRAKKLPQSQTKEYCVPSAVTERNFQIKMDEVKAKAS